MSLAALIAWSVRARHLVIAVTLLLALAGGAALRHTPLDALPNVAEPQVIVRTAYPGRTPEQVERDVGYPLATALSAVPGVTAVRYVSPSDARREVVADKTEASLAALPAEAFPASLEIELGNAVSEVQVASMTEKLAKIGPVESIETYQRYTDKLKSLLHAGVAASLVLALVVLAAVVSVVASTVRLAMQRRKIEIEVLHLVGATEQYVRRPFVVEGCVQGAAGAAAAVLLLSIMYLVVREHVADVLRVMIGVPPTFLPWYAIAGLVMLGAAIGAVASHFSLKRMVTV